MAVVTPPSSDILFYDTGSDYDLFSNTTPVVVNVTLNGVQFSASSSEAVFQGLKGLTSVTPGTAAAAADLIRTDKVGSEVQRLGGKPPPGGMGVIDLSGDTPPMVYDRPYVTNPPDPPVPSSTTVKEQVMYELVLAKATQNPQILKALLATGDRPITEDTSKKPPPTGRAITEADDDRTWGNGWTDAQRAIYGLPPAAGPGGNALGKAWMRARDTLRDELNRTNAVQVRAGLSDSLAKTLGHTAHVAGSQYASTPPITAKDLADLPLVSKTGAPIKQVADLDSAHMAKRIPPASSMSMGADSSESAKAASGLGKGATPSGGTAPGGSTPSIAVGTPGGKTPSIGIGAGKTPSIAVGAPGGAAPSIGVPMPGKKGIELSGGDKEGPELASGGDKKKEEDEEKFKGTDLSWESWFSSLFKVLAGKKSPIARVMGAGVMVAGGLLQTGYGTLKGLVTGNWDTAKKGAKTVGYGLAAPLTAVTDLVPGVNLAKKLGDKNAAMQDSVASRTEQVNADTRERQDAGEALKHGETGSTPAYNTKLAAGPGVHKISEGLKAKEEKEAKEEEERLAKKIADSHERPPTLH